MTAGITALAIILICWGLWSMNLRQCTAVNTRFLFTLCKEFQETFYFCLQRCVISKKHIHCMTKFYKLSKPMGND